jgi:hypothetical protein
MGMKLRDLMSGYDDFLNVMCVIRCYGEGGSQVRANFYFKPLFFAIHSSYLLEAFSTGGPGGGHVLARERLKPPRPLLFGLHAWLE